MPRSLHEGLEYAICHGVKIEDVRNFPRERRLVSGGVDHRYVEQTAAAMHRATWAAECDIIKPLLFFDLYVEWNASALSDRQLMTMVFELIGASLNIDLEQIEFSEGPQQHGGRRKREIEGLYKRLLELLQDSENLPTTVEFERLWTEKVLPIACCSLVQIVDAKLGIGWRYDPFNAEHRSVLMGALKDLIASNCQRGKPPRKVRQKTISFLMRHYCLLTGSAKFNWSNAGGPPTDGERFASNVFEVMAAVPVPTGEDFRKIKGVGN